MAKRRKSYKRKSSKCPEPINTLIDLSAALTLDYMRSKQRKKNGAKKNKIDPYAATGVAMGMGKLKSTEDILQFGGILGAMGAFDDEPSCQYNNIGTNIQKQRDNRYAWRLNCEDGSGYGIAPEDYETKAMYDCALQKAKAAPHFIYCRVSCLKSGANIYCRTENETWKVGDRVPIMKPDRESEDAIILTVEHYTRETVPIPLEETGTF
jgi:hypothetical protein